MHIESALVAVAGPVAVEGKGITVGLRIVLMVADRNTVHFVPGAGHALEVGKKVMSPFQVHVDYLAKHCRLGFVDLEFEHYTLDQGSV